MIQTIMFGQKSISNNNKMKLPIHFDLSMLSPLSSLSFDYKILFIRKKLYQLSNVHIYKYVLEFLSVLFIWNHHFLIKGKIIIHNTELYCLFFRTYNEFKQCRSYCTTNPINFNIVNKKKHTSFRKKENTDFKDKTENRS